MKKVVYWLLKTVCYLEISTLSTLGVLVTINTVRARPLCYFQDANGRIVNLSFICAKPSRPTKPLTQNKKNTQEPSNNSTPDNISAPPVTNDSQNSNISPENNNIETNKPEEVDNSQPDTS